MLRLILASKRAAETCHLGQCKAGQHSHAPAGGGEQRAGSRTREISHHVRCCGVIYHSGLSPRVLGISRHISRESEMIYQNPAMAWTGVMMSTSAKEQILPPSSPMSKLAVSPLSHSVCQMCHSSPQSSLAMPFPFGQMSRTKVFFSKKDIHFVVHASSSF